MRQSGRRRERARACGAGPVADMDATRYELAVHECGHACCALIVGHGARAVIVYDGGGGLCLPDLADASPPGTFDPEQPPETPAVVTDWKDAIVRAIRAAGGFVAVDLVLHPERTETEIPDSDDRRRIETLARGLMRGCDLYAQSAFVALAAAEARRRLRPFKWRIKLAARALYERGRLSGDEVMAAMFPEHCCREEVSECAECDG